MMLLHIQSLSLKFINAISVSLYCNFSRFCGEVLFCVFVEELSHVIRDIFTKIT